MTLVATPLAEWLKAPELVETHDNAVVEAVWGGLSTDSHVSSSLALRSEVAVEAASQAVFFGQPVAVETVEVAGFQAKLVGTAQRIFCDIVEYDQGPVVFVIGAEERQAGTTLITVLRRVVAA